MCKTYYVFPQFIIYTVGFGVLHTPNTYVLLQRMLIRRVLYKMYHFIEIAKMRGTGKSWNTSGQ